MTYLLRRLPLSRLLLLCGLVVVLGISATALASALSTGPTPPRKSLANAVHDALTATPVQGVSAHIQLTDHLLEGASLASGGGGDSSSAAGQLASSPLLTGASGRMWIAKDGRVRLELQAADKGDTQVLYDGHTVSIYDGASNTLYRYTIPAHEGGTSSGTDSPTSPTHHEVPTVAKIEEAISHSDHVSLSEAKPDDIAGQAAYTVRVTPKERGSLIAAGELSFDAVHGAPLRAAIYSSHSPSSPTIELAATEISYAPVDSSVFAFTPPSGAKIEEVKPPEGAKSTDPSAAQSGDHPLLSAHGQGIATVAAIESKTQESAKGSSSTLPEGLQKVKINGIEAAELPTALGTLLSFERSGARYLLLGAVAPSAVEAVAKGL
jgi:outer membrane lipoprotein-sorting protein